MDPTTKYVYKPPTFVNTRFEMESVEMERAKLEAELRDLEGHMMTFEESILKRGGPYFGRIAQGERAEQIIQEITKIATKQAPSASKIKSMSIQCRDLENSSEFDRPRRVRHSDRLFSNSSVTSPSMLLCQTETNTTSENSQARNVNQTVKKLR